MATRGPIMGPGSKSRVPGPITNLEAPHGTWGSIPDAGTHHGTRGPITISGALLRALVLQPWRMCGHNWAGG